MSPSNELAALITTKNIKITLEDGSTQSSDINQATSMMISKALSIVNSGASTINHANTELQNFYVNVMNDYLNVQKKANWLYVDQIIA